MADQGGYRTPSPATPPSGPGRFSQRTDNQKVATPNVGESDDLNQGDRQRLEAAQRLAPIPNSKGPVTGHRRGVDRGAASARGDEGIPREILDELTRRPEQPTTAGLDVGAGEDSSILPSPPPKEDRELILEYYQDLYSNSAAAEWLAELRQPPAEVPSIAPPAPLAPPQAEAPLPEDDVIDFDADIEAERSGTPTEEEETTENDPLASPLPPEEVAPVEDTEEEAE